MKYKLPCRKEKDNHLLLESGQNNTLVNAQIGTTAKLPCLIFNRDDHETVSWIRSRDHHLITVGRQTYSSDNRFSVNFNRHLSKDCVRVRNPAMNTSCFSFHAVSSHLSSYNGAHRKPRFGSSKHHRTPTMVHSGNKQSESSHKLWMVFARPALSLDDALDPGPEAPTGLLHNLPVHGGAVILDGGNERCLGGIKASVSTILENALKEIIHWVYIRAAGRPSVLGYEVVAVLLQPGEGAIGDMARSTVQLPHSGPVPGHLLHP
ncbi:hypothetical protein FHG87_015563 [Trinorchestia longiramus]|nr:hypothetical protein FHG87_015563 [Trinorchestia longiramus]